MALAVTFGPSARAAKKSAHRPAPAPARVEAGPSDRAAVTALGDAFRAFAAGDAAKALALAPPEGAVLRNPDYATWIRAEAEAALDRGEALADYERLAAQPSSRFQRRAAWRAADVLWDLGRTAEASTRYQALIKAPPEDVDVIVGRARIAEQLGTSGKIAPALAAWRALVLDAPLHPAAIEAEARLQKIGAPPLTPRERLIRAQKLKSDRRWDEAIAELDKIPEDVPAGLKDQITFWRGETLFSMRRDYAKAGELLLAVAPRMGKLAAQARFHGARARSRADHDDDAIAGYRDVVRLHPRTEWAEEAQFLIGWLEYNRAHYAEALPGLRATVKKYPRSKWAVDARWFAAYSLFLTGDHAAAIKELAPMAKRGGALEGGKARYWTARSLDALKKPAEATAIYRDLVKTYPFTWYALLARARLADRKEPVGPWGEKTPTASTQALGEPDPTLADDALIGRVDELIAAGLLSHAAAELRRGERAFVRAVGNPRALPVLLDRYTRAEDWNRPWQLAEGYGARALAAPPTGPARAIWEQAYPRAYRTLVEKWEGLGKNPSYWLYAIMRKESGFDPRTVSYADAMGLLQMIPPTTKRVAEAIKIPYVEGMLYDPETNIRVASWYIGKMYAKFRGQNPLAAGAFNAGPRPIMRWLDDHGKRPIDEMVELSAYTQTREYMKKVTGYYARYLYLYEDKVYEQRLDVDTRYVVDEVDY